jgi:hypothetical protein
MSGSWTSNIIGGCDIIATVSEAGEYLMTMMMCISSVCFITPIMSKF